MSLRNLYASNICDVSEHTASQAKQTLRLRVGFHWDEAISSFEIGFSLWHLQEWLFLEVTLCSQGTSIPDGATVCEHLRSHTDPSTSGSLSKGPTRTHHYGSTFKGLDNTNIKQISPFFCKKYKQKHFRRLENKNI